MQHARAAAAIVLALTLAPAFPAAGQATPAPDLAAASPTLEPATPTAGEVVRFAAVVRNDGDADAGSFRVTFRLDGAVLGNVSVSGLAAQGDRRVESPTWTSAQGSHRVEVVVDSVGDVTESQESDNTAARNFSVGAHVARPELQELDATLDPADPQPGQQVLLTVRVRNAGDANAGAFKVRFFVGEDVLGTRSLLGVAANGIVNAPMGWAFQGSEQEVRFVLDADKQVRELDEFNNERTFRIGEESKPDLVVTDLTLTPAQPRAGERVEVVAHVKNVGGARAGAFHVGVFGGATRWARVAFGGLDPDRSVRVEASGTAPAAGQDIRVVADLDKEVAESKEDNNERSSAGTAASGPDLVVQALAAAGDPRAGAATTFRATVANAGSRAADATHLVFSVDGRRLGEVPVPALAAGGSRVVSSPAWTATAGTHTVLARADARGAVAEAREGNNERSLRVEVAANAGPGWDLAVVELAAEPMQALPGRVVALAAAVQVTGPAPREAYAVRFLVDGAEIAREPLPDAGTVVRANWTATAGTHNLAARIEGARDDVPTNDVATLSLVVGGDGPPVIDPGAGSGGTGLPDLVVLSVGPEASPDPGGARILARVANRGTGDAPLFSLDFYVDGARLSTAGLPGLRAGEELEAASLPWNGAAGAHTFRAIADPAGQVAESDEENNEATASTGDGGTAATGANGTPGPPAALAALAVAAAALVGRARRRRVP